MPKDKEEKKNKSEDKEPTLEEQLEKAKADVEHWKNEYYRAYADTKNLRDSLEKDHKEAMKYRASGFVEELLPVLDSFHVVLSNEPDDPKLKNYLVGFQFIYQNLVRALEAEGVTEISPNVNDPFDANTMNATDTVEDETPNLVKKINAKGYKLRDRLIRPAVVTVSIAKKTEEIKPDDEKKPQESVEIKQDSNENQKEDKNETKSDA